MSQGPGDLKFVEGRPVRKANGVEEEEEEEEEKGRSWTRQPPLDSRINLGSSRFWPRGHEVEVSRTIGPFVSAGTKDAEKRRRGARRALSRMDLIKKHNLEGGRITGSRAACSVGTTIRSSLPPLPHE